MGNTPTKLDSGSSTPNGTNTSGTYDIQNGDVYRNRSRHASLANALLNNSSVGMMGGYNNRQRAHSMFDKMDRDKEKRKSTKEREQLKELHARGLVVKYDESCDGGFLAPFGCYGFDKLDYNVVIVKRLIVERKLAPFYTPLQDFDESWSREEIIKIVDGLPLHATFEENLEEFEDVPLGNLDKPNFDYLIDKTLTKKEQRRQHSKIFKARLYRKRLIWQETANETFLEDKMDVRIGKAKNRYLPSDDLKYSLYNNGTECPICFLYVPGPLNYSKCCQQPICTECFVQIKRAEPHFPHEEVDPTQPVTDDDAKDPNLLISEPSNCPYCATPNFCITYKPPKDRRTGLGGTSPGEYYDSVEVNADNKEAASTTSISSPRSSSSITTPNDKFKSVEKVSVVFSDDIRPDWEAKLKKERARLAKRSANATAIHVSNQLVDPEYSTRQSSNSEIPTPSSTHWNRSIHATEQTTIDELENEMVQHAIKLSLEDNKKARRK